MYKWFLAWRYLHTKLIAIFAVLGVTLCVAMVLVVMSVMGGFLDTIKERSRGLLADVILDAGTLQGWPFYQEFADYVERELPGVVAHTTPVIYTYGVLRVPVSTYTKPARIVGIRFDEYCQVNDFARGLHYAKYWPGTTHLGPQEQPLAGLDDSGRLRLPPDLEAAHQRWREAPATTAAEREAFDRLPFGRFPRDVAERLYDTGLDPGYRGPAHHGVIIGCDLINIRREDGNYDRAYARGLDMALMVLPLTSRGTVTAEGAIKIPLRYADDSRTGVYEVDSINVYVDFDMLQQRLAMDAQQTETGMTNPRTAQLLISLEEGIDLVDGRNRINAAWQRFLDSLGNRPSAEEWPLLNFVEVQSWEDLQRPFIAAVEKEKVLVTFLFGIISLVAIVLIGCIFYMIVQKKTKDIGILKALGARGSGVAGLFIIYAACVGVVGSILGTGIGATFVWYINDIQDFLIRLSPELQVWSPEVYTFDKIPNVVKLPDVLGIAFTAILASMLGSVIPAIIAGRIWPVEALRYE